MIKNNEATITAEPGKQEIVITREFDAPRELVFKAFTDPELYIQWVGPRRLTMTLETFEPSVIFIKSKMVMNMRFMEYIMRSQHLKELSKLLNLKGFRKKDMLLSKQQGLKKCRVAGQSLLLNPLSNRLQIEMACFIPAWKRASTIRMSVSTSLWRK
jgi:hypothetical protein